MANINIPKRNYVDNLINGVITPDQLTTITNQLQTALLQYLTEDQVNQIITNILNQIGEQNLSYEEVSNLISNELTSKLTEEQVQSMIDAAMSGISNESYVTKDELNNIISQTSSNTETDPVAMPILSSHIATDQSRWADYYDTKLKLLGVSEKIEGRIPDMNKLTYITTPAQSEVVTINSGDGEALIVVVFTNKNGNFTTISYTNGGNVLYSSEGLADNVTFTTVESILLLSTLDRDITITNATSIEVLYYTPDPNSPMNLELDHQIVNTEFQTQVETPIDIKTGEQLITATEFGFDVQNLVDHRTTDKGRWDDVDEFEGEIIDSVINAKGMKLETAGNVDVRPYSSSMMYTVTNDLGGLLTVIITNTDTTFGEIYINGILRYSTNGLVSGVPTTKYYPLKDNDTVYVTNSTSAIFTPYIADPSSQLQQLLATINYQNSVIVNLQTQINDNEASINNKTIAGVIPIDITNSTYTINNELGARVTGQGDSVLGLLGITIASTGVTTFSPLSPGVKNYDNTALLSGDAPTFSVNVSNGTTITSSGMSYVTVYNYIPG